MTRYEALVDCAWHRGIKVYDWSFDDPELLGLYCDGHIAIEKDLDEDAKVCTLAEELGHHFTSDGIIIDMRQSESRRQEYVARKWAIERILPLERIAKGAVKCEGLELWELAEHLKVPDRFLLEAISYYKNKYGLYKEVDNCCIYFEPLTVALYEF